MAEPYRTFGLSVTAKAETQGFGKTRAGSHDQAQDKEKPE